MKKTISGRIARVRGRLSSLPLPLLALLGVVIAAGSGAGGYYAYKTYDYVEHDNEFCFSCHLMQEPYELFAQSAHRGLGCKACHQPNMMERGQMGLTGIVVNPDTIAVHAEVPNDLCADCHVEGDPERWTLIASSAGHRVHLESDDPSLQGLQCVECHSSSLHQFTAVDQTCAQSGCHTDSGIQLGEMSDLTIHCAGCHSFSAPVEDQVGALAALAPDESTCLSCHIMRTLVDMPDPDPHENACAACHDPHEQTTPDEAVESCATADCHSAPMDLTPFHQGLAESVMADCLYCHQAHDFQIDGANCTACHTEILDDDPAAVPPSAYHPTPRAPARVVVAGSDGASRPTAIHGGPVATVVHRPPPSWDEGLLHSWGYPLPQVSGFLHSEHASVDCAGCHESTEGHGRLTVTTITDCRSCHHAEETVRPEGCASCHEGSGTMADPYHVGQTLGFSTGGTASRALPFDHERHIEVDCAACHTEGVELSAAGVECASCHEEHHEPANDCMSCHLPTGEGTHSIETAHVTCSGSGCHTDVPFQGLPRTNTVCLTCHQDMVDHRPGGECAECHALPGGGVG